MDNLKYFLIMNPSSRSGKGRRICERILSEFSNKKLDFDYKFTKGSEDAIAYSSEAVKDGWDVIVAAGGDGTICEVISGIFSNGYANNTRLGILHIGTSPDFNRYHNIPVKLDDAIEILLKNKTKKIDIGKVTYMKSNSEKAVSYFGSNVNVGLGPLIASKANSRHRKYLGDFLGTLCASLGSLFNFKGVDLNVKIDGRESNLNRLINLTIGKDPYLASGMRVFSEIKPDDGRLFILSIKRRSMFSLLTNIYKLYLGDFLQYKGANITYAKEVEISCSSERVPIEFDGDVKGYLPAKIEVLPRALEVMTA